MPQRIHGEDLQSRLIWVGVALLLLILSLFAAMRELGANAARGKSDIAYYEDAVAGELPGPMSFSGTQRVLVDCIDMVNSFYGKVQPVAVQRQLAAACGDMARDSLRSNPNYGLGALVAAHMALIDDDWKTFNKYLQLSQQGAPAEQWISVERLRLYTNYQERLESEAQQARADDIRLLLASPVGIGSIARLYLDSEPLRNLVADEAEKLPEGVQARFVGTLRRMLRN